MAIQNFLNCLLNEEENFQDVSEYFTDSKLDFFWKFSVDLLF